MSLAFTEASYTQIRTLKRIEVFRKWQVGIRDYIILVKAIMTAVFGNGIIPRLRK